MNINEMIKVSQTIVRTVKTVKKVFLYSLCILSLLVITGCTATYAPVEQRSAVVLKKQKYSGKAPNYYIVKKGDTLFSIAWVYGFDYKSIANNNRIKAPYRIYAGQKIYLKTAVVKKQAAKVKTKGVKTKSRVQKTAKKNTTAKYINKNNNNKIIIVPKTSAGTVLKNSSKLRWSWPIRGKVIQKFSPSRGKKGIDISAASGSAIKSSETGKVVYSGQGLVGYGRMIIIKHNDIYLSAYAHNQSLLVIEGQFVKKGQTIARLGRSGTDKFKLHFEIRKNGKPVNPLTYLPR